VGNARRAQGELETRESFTMLPDTFGQENFLGDKHPRWLTTCPAHRATSEAVSSIASSPKKFFDRHYGEK
jgi:hypothetical protein